MTRRAYSWQVVLVAAVCGACSPYEQSGEFYAGSVDPKDFPAVYRGAGAATSQFGTFEANAAFVKGEAVGYYAFPVPAGVMPTRTTTAPSVYVFDPSDASPFPAPGKCVAPSGYAFDQRRDFVRYDEQGNIFTRLPTRTVDMLNVTERFTYVPLVAEVAVTSMGEPCQESKSASNLVTRKDVSMDIIPPAMNVPNAMATGKPNGKFLAWALIDPAAEVLFPDGSTDPKTHLGPQKWGWFDHFLVAYIDGGYVPTMTMAGAMPTSPPVTVLVPQNLFFPSVVMDGADMVPVDDIGSGFDVLQFKRGEAGYSPLCRVMVYTPADPTMPAKDATAIAMATPTGKFVYCLQPEKQAP